MLGARILLLARSSGVALAPAPPTRPILGAGGRLVPLAALAVQPVAGPRLNGGYPVALNSPRLNSPQMRGPSGLGGGATVVRVARSLRVKAPPPSGTPPIKTIVGTGASTVGGLVSSGTGAEIITGTGASTVGGLISSGTGAEVFQGTGASRVGGIVSSGIGADTYTGTGASRVGGLRSAGTGAEVFTGTGASRVLGLRSSGTGADVISGTGASRVGGVLSVGSGTSTGSTVTGSGASRLLPVRSNGVGGLAIVGSGASVLGGVLSSGYGLGIWYAAMASIAAVPLVTARIVATNGASAVIGSASVARAIISRRGPPTMNVGTAELFTCSVTDANGNPCAPGSVVAEMSLPNGATVPLSPVLNPTLGAYTAQFIPTLAGVHTIRFNGTAPYVFQQDQQYICTGPAF